MLLFLSKLLSYLRLNDIVSNKVAYIELFLCYGLLS